MLFGLDELSDGTLAGPAIFCVAMMGRGDKVTWFSRCMEERFRVLRASLGPLRLAAPFWFANDGSSLPPASH